MSTSKTRIAYIDQIIFRFETGLAACCLGGLSLLMLVNAALRALGHPLIWGDELAINLMVWTAFLGASIAIATRQQVAVTLLSEALHEKARLYLALFVDLLVLCAILLLASLVWHWFDLPGLLRSGSPAELATQTYNFIYQEPTVTLGFPKAILWGILPVFCLCATFHALVIFYTDLHRLRAGHQK